MKKALCALIALMIIISFAACNKASENPPVVNDTEQSGASESTTETEPPTITTEPTETTAPQTDAPTTEPTTSPTTEPPTTLPTTEPTTEPTTAAPPTQASIDTMSLNVSVKFNGVNVPVGRYSISPGDIKVGQIIEISANHSSGIKEIEYALSIGTLPQIWETTGNSSITIKPAHAGGAVMQLLVVAGNGEKSFSTYSFNIISNMEPTQPPATQAPTTTPPPPTKPPTDGRRTEPVTMQRPVATNVSDTSLSTGGFLRCLSALYGGNVLAEQTGDFAEYSAYAGILKTFTYVHSPDYLTEKGLLAPITRAEVAYVMACALQSHPSLGFRHFMNQMVIDNSITDCDTLIIDSDVYAIYFVVKYNLMSVTDGNFRPYDALSVDEMNQIILELLAI